MRKFGNVMVDFTRGEVTRAGMKIELTALEFDLLVALARKPRQVFTREVLLEQVWEYHFDPKSNIVETHISRLRGKVDCGGPSLIQTVRGAGYMLRVPNPVA